MRVFFKVEGKSNIERVLRGFGVLFVIIGVVMLFSWNFNRKFDQIKSKLDIVDLGNVLSKDERAQLREYASRFQTTYGITLKIKVTNKHLQIPSLDPKTLFIGLNTTEGFAVVEFPPLVARALGPDFVLYLKENHFNDYIKTARYGLGIEVALQLLWEELNTGLHEQGSS
ncbi:hypothetical protein [Desulfovibrio inopinatus]|uniref:hypothetical protein n=1 Tax=Desulfovibrio inopinatus TaxID=102109 RepID=UPI000426684A|nr:hypothetical protein [Desulfovibrio inopinatus]